MKNTDYVYKDDLDKVCFEHDMAYSKFNNLDKRTQSEIILTDKGFEYASNPKLVDYQRGLAPMVFMFFDKKSTGSGIKSEIKENQQLANELHDPIVRKCKR